MTVFIDTTIFVAATTEEPGRGTVAVEFLNEVEEPATTLLSLMGFRTVLAKKKAGQTRSS